MAIDPQALEQYGFLVRLQLDFNAVRDTLPDSMEHHVNNSLNGLSLDIKNAHGPDVAAKFVAESREYLQNQIVKAHDVRASLKLYLDQENEEYGLDAIHLSTLAVSSSYTPEFNAAAKILADQVAVAKEQLIQLRIETERTIIEKYMSFPRR